MITFKTYIIMFLTALTVVACSHIDESERLIYVKPEPAKRCVLLEDFTGQRCVNCPTATEVIEQLQQMYGDSVVIAVGIHGGPLAFAGNDKYEGLSTDEGDTYYKYWNLEYQPVGLVDRHGALNYTDWIQAVKEELTKTAPVKMEMSAKAESGLITLELEETGIDGTTEGKLQVWVIEDRIAGLQMMPDGTANTAYQHNHVLRAVVNGLWGDDFSIGEGEKKSQVMTKAIEKGWNVKNLSAVAFIYNDQGVQQAVKAKVSH
ncbi:MAG: Omp28 family outer membrane lipoprotein [Prevotella sp.]|nr:Omp28 family outer membrane lipoprotein [Prevotella sp.]